MNEPSCSTMKCKRLDPSVEVLEGTVATLVVQAKANYGLQRLSGS
jgi:hypothetical protein